MGIMAVPQRMTTVTLGARSVPALRAFYQAIGWRENDGSDDTFASFTLGGVRLALYPIEQLRDEAAPQEVSSRLISGMAQPWPSTSRHATKLTTFSTVLSPLEHDRSGRLSNVSGADTPATSQIPKATAGRSPGRRGSPTPSSAEEPINAG